jgi:hypothetical protein
VVCMLLGLFAVQAMYAMSRHSATFDETAHLPAGYAHVTVGDLRLNPEHPPLAKLLAGVPLLWLKNVQFSSSWWQWRVADEFRLGQRFLSENDPSRLLFWGRLPMVLLSCLLGALLYGWARELHGHAAATYTLALFAFTPEFLAHGALVTTDMAAATWVFAAFYCLWRSLSLVTARDVMLCGCALGAALATKFSTLAFLPLFVIAPVSRALHPTALTVRFGRSWLPPLPASTLELTTRAARAVWLLGACLCAALLAWAVVWACYGLQASLPEQDNLPVLDWRAVSYPVTLGSRGVLALRELHLLPDTYLYGVLFVLQRSAARFSFLLGEFSLYGFRWYFPITALVKTPIPELVLFLAGLIVAGCDVRARRWQRCVIVVPALLHFTVAMAGNLNIGHRHLLPMYPFLLLAAASAIAYALERVWSTAAVAMLMAWLAAGTLVCAPDYLAYFNEAVGGSRGGLDVVVDSNLDWGQDLPGLKRWMSEQHVSKVYLSYFGSAVPEAYGIDYEALPSFFSLQRPVSGELDPRKSRYIAISATNLQKVYLQYPQNEWFLNILDSLRTRAEPVAVIGGSIYVYDLSTAVAR